MHSVQGNGEDYQECYDEVSGRMQRVKSTMDSPKGYRTLLIYYSSLKRCINTWVQLGHSLRSASRGDFVVPRARTAIKQHRAFSIVGPSVWNSFPSEIRSLPRDLSTSFYKLLMIFIFAWALAGSASE